MARFTDRVAAGTAVGCLSVFHDASSDAANRCSTAEQAEREQVGQGA
jgi:hypothetical protein